MTDPQIGPYTIQQPIGSGGMADVYLAWDHANRWPVAVKVLRSAPGKDAKLIKRFEREASLLMKLRHPHIIQVYDAGQTADGRTYIAMEYIGGGDLDDLMQFKTGSKLAVTEAVYLMRRVAGAVAYAHERGIVHRDLKPSNILLRADSGEPVVTDLGIASLAGAKPLTGTMESLGTPQYMAPEQASNQGMADGRADVYAIGVMLYELLTGRLPFEAENGWALLLTKQRAAAPSILTTRRDLDARLAAVVDACLQRDPAARYQTAGALATALDAFLPADAHPPAPVPAKYRKGVVTPRGGSSPSTPSGPRTPATPFSQPSRRPSPLLWAGGAALALVLLLALIITLLGGGRQGGSTATSGTDIGQATETNSLSPEPAKSESTIPGQPTSTLAPQIEDEPLVEVVNSTPDLDPPTPTRSLSTPTRSTGAIGRATVRAVRDIYTSSGPGLSYPALGGLSRGEVVTVLGRNSGGDWYLVNSAGGPVWVYEDYITAVSGSLASIPVAATIPVQPTLTPTATPTAEGTAVTSNLPPITLLEPPPAACPPGTNAPSYSAGDTITFRWNWPAATPAGAYLEVRAGLVGRIVSQGRVNPADHRQNDEWAFPVSGSVIFRDGDGAYQWAVYLVGGNGQLLLNSPVSCFGLVGNGSGGSPPTDTDSDGDGVPDSQDQCPNEPFGNEDDPNRPGCPPPTPPQDSDNDGILDPDDPCPNERPGPYPDPGRPGCPRPYP